MTKTVSEILSAAADLLEAPNAWTQGWFARTAVGTQVTSKSPHAVCWCAIGAIRKSSVAGEWQQVDRAIRAIEGGPTIPKGAGLYHWNDSPERTQSEVVAALREASKLAKAS